MRHAEPIYEAHVEASQMKSTNLLLLLIIKPGLISRWRPVGLHERDVDCQIPVWNQYFMNEPQHPPSFIDIFLPAPPSSLLLFLSILYPT